MGPVDAITLGREGAEFTVAGQVYKTSTNAAGSYAVGDYVVVAADADGNIDVLYSAGVSYVPGASPVMVMGQIESTDPSRASLSVGATILDYSAHLAVDPTFRPVSGTIVEARGIQPVRGGIIVISP